MDWNSLKFDWNHARCFLIVAEVGSYTDAAKVIGVAPSSVSRQIASLEEELGVALLEKAGKKLSITPSGRFLLEFVSNMAESANQFSLQAAGRSKSTTGKVSITSTEPIAAFVLPPILNRLRKIQPGIDFELKGIRTIQDLRKREADIAIRLKKPMHSELISKKLPDCFGRLYASTGYLRQIGSPNNFEDISKADFIGFVDNQPYIEMLNGLGLSVNEENFAFQTDDHLIHWALVKAGIGIGSMLECVGEPDPEVRLVHPMINPIKVESWLVAHRDLKNSRRIRHTFDFLFDELSILFRRKWAFED